MKCLVAINPFKASQMDYESVGKVLFGPKEVEFVSVDLPVPYFDNKLEKNRDYVLVKVKSFSCNYRDKSFIISNYEKMAKTDRLFIPFGSEFSGEIIALGDGVTEFKKGDMVMPNCAYPDSGVEGILPGVSTNFASLGWLRLHKVKLIKSPKNFNNEEGACFSLGAQTASSMIIRSGVLGEGTKPLVLSARSATSMFIIQQLLAYGLKPVCLSTSEWTEKEKTFIKPASIKTISRDGMLENDLSHQFTHVFDPFFDMNIEKGMNALAMGGTYISCGIRDQHPLLSDITPTQLEAIVRNSLVQSVMKNISFIGNCLGQTKDLEKAIELQEKRNFKPMIDSRYTVEEGGRFVERSFFDKSRFGKCVMNYSDK